MKDFTELKVWQEAHKFTLMVYKATQKWPKEELFGLTLQTRKATGSIEFNTAEGFGRFTRAKFRHHCNIAHGSLFETQSELMVARDLRYNSHEEWLELHEQSLVVLKLLRALMRTLDPS